MTLNPIREAFRRSGLLTSSSETPFQVEADDALAEYLTLLDDLEWSVLRRGMSKEEALRKGEAGLAAFRDSLRRRVESYGPIPSVFLDRLNAARHARRKAREHMTLEAIQREANRLLRQILVELQIQNRTLDFRAGASATPVTGEPTALSLERLLEFHSRADQAGDPAALEWSRRQLEAHRPRAFSPDDQERIDRATDRPDQVNPRTVARHAKTLSSSSPEVLESFVIDALATRDANACTAAFLRARECPEGKRPRWARMVLNGLDRFPDAALAALQALETEGRNAESRAARAQAEYAIEMAESQFRILASMFSPNKRDPAQVRTPSQPVSRQDATEADCTRS